MIFTSEKLKVQFQNIIKRDDIKVASPGQGLSPQKYEKLLGISLKRDMDFEDYFFESDLIDSEEMKKDFVFLRNKNCKNIKHKLLDY